MEIQISWKTSEAVYFFTPPQVALENLTLEETGESNETFQREGEEWKRKVFLLRLKAEKPGAARIRAFRLNYIDPTTQKGGFFDVSEKELKISHNFARFYPTLAVSAGAVAFGGLLSVWLLSRGRRPVTATEPEETGPEGHYLFRLQSGSITLTEAERLLRAYLKEKYPGETKEKLSLKESKILEKIVGKLEEARFAGRVNSAEERRLLGEIIRFIENRRVVVESPDQN